ncbi:MAG: GNAT family N-acetyltransferase [Cyanobacteria bacterium SIG26]|nr:GNAT family N-acetyltransferase [Cyanobacteria bacterium SIG26]
MIKLHGLIRSPIYNSSAQKLPDRLVYFHTKKQRWGTVEHNFKIISKYSSKLLGEMVCVPSKVYRKDVGEVNSLYIEYLSANKNIGQGVGRDLFNLAKIHSEQVGCGGYIYLESSDRLLPDKAPHTFYRKMGMNTGIKWVDEVLDVYISSGKYLQKGDLPILRMHYPPINVDVKSQTPLYKRIFMHIKDYFTIKH